VPFEEVRECGNAVALGVRARPPVDDYGADRKTRFLVSRVCEGQTEEHRVADYSL